MLRPVLLLFERSLSAKTEKKKGQPFLLGLTLELLFLSFLLCSPRLGTTPKLLRLSSVQLSP